MWQLCCSYSNFVWKTSRCNTFTSSSCQPNSKREYLTIRACCCYTTVFVPIHAESSHKNCRNCRQSHTSTNKNMLLFSAIILFTVHRTMRQVANCFLTGKNLPRYAMHARNVRDVLKTDLWWWERWRADWPTPHRYRDPSASPVSGCRRTPRCSPGPTAELQSDRAERNCPERHRPRCSENLRSAIISNSVVRC